MSNFASNTPTLTEILEMVKQNWLGEIHTCMPGVVENFDAATQSASVRLGFKRAYNDGTVREYQVVANVPVFFPATQEAWLRFPVAAGDTVLVHFAERALDNWWLNGGSQDPELPRKFSTNDAIAVPGLRTKGNAITPNGASSSAELAFGGAYVEITNTGTVKIMAANGQKLVMGNGVVELMDELVKLLTQLTTASNILGAGPPTAVVSQFNPAVLAQLLLIKTALEGLKQ